MCLNIYLTLSFVGGDGNGGMLYMLIICVVDLVAEHEDMVVEHDDTVNLMTMKVKKKE